MFPFILKKEIELSAILFFLESASDGSDAAPALLPAECPPLPDVHHLQLLFLHGHGGRKHLYAENLDLLPPWDPDHPLLHVLRGTELL